jgi:hypothetical protein
VAVRALPALQDLQEEASRQVRQEAVLARPERSPAASRFAAESPSAASPDPASSPENVKPIRDGKAN